MALTSCCGCFSLRTGAAFYGIIGLAVQVVALILLSIAAIRLELAFTHIENNYPIEPPYGNVPIKPPYDEVSIKPPYDNIPPIYGIQKVINPIYYVLRALIAGVIVYLIVMVIITVLFLIGVGNKNPNYLLPYICVIFTHIMISLAATVANGLNFYEIWQYYLIAALELGFLIYQWMIMFYFYKESIAEKVLNEGKIHRPSPGIQV